MMMIALYVLILNFIVNPTNLIYASLHCAKNCLSPGVLSFLYWKVLYLAPYAEKNLSVSNENAFFLIF